METNITLYNRAVMEPVTDAFLLESAHGKNINGNVFAVLSSLREDPDFDDRDIFLAVVEEKIEEAEARLKHYDIENVRIIEREGDEYLRALATSGYLINDNSFPAYFFKRPEQIYLNTWHGTPLKALGRKDLDNAVSLGNVQANMVKADYLLFPNLFTKEIMMKDFMVEKVYGGRTVIMDYPRNDALYNRRFREDLSERFDLEGKRVIAYMPTWRGTGRDIDVDRETVKAREVIADIVTGLEDDDILFVNMHFLIGDGLDLSGFNNVYSFPKDYETYDFLSICDVLITDYSSVSIDFAQTGKEIILYLYDYRDYSSTKNFYYDVNDLPFKKAYTCDELVDALRSETPGYALDERLISPNKGKASSGIIDLITKGREEGRQVEDHSKRECHTRIAYFDNITKEENFSKVEKYISGLAPQDRGNTVIMFPDLLRPETIENLKKIPLDMDFVKISGRMYLSDEEEKTLSRFKKLGLFKKKAGAIYKREADRQINSFRLKEFDIVYAKAMDRLNILAEVRP